MHPYVAACLPYLPITLQDRDWKPTSPLAEAKGQLISRIFVVYTHALGTDVTLPQTTDGAMTMTGDSGVKSSPRGGRAVQARIDADTARKFDAVARARNMTDSQLLRYSIDLMLKEAAQSLDKLQEDLLMNIANAKKALAESPSTRQNPQRPADFKAPPR
jgi:antitoxin component of RelBE/YafQ-DinJ toxin-antitoxin module